MKSFKQFLNESDGLTYTDICKHYNIVSLITKSLLLDEMGMTSFEGLPEEFSGDIFCQHNKLKSFQYAPKKIDGSLYCGNNMLESFKYCPQEIEYSLYVEHNNISSFDFITKELKDLDISHNKFTSLKGIANHIDTIRLTINISHNPIENGMLDLLKIKKLKHIECLNCIDYLSYSSLDRVADVLNKYLKNKTSSVCTTKEILTCKAELEREGLGNFI